MEDNPLSPSDDPARLSDLLNLPESLQSAVRSLRRQPSFTLADLADLAGEIAAAEALLSDLQGRGLAESLPPELPEDEPRYRLRLKGRRKSPLGDRIWQQLEEPDHE